MDIRSAFDGIDAVSAVSAGKRGISLFYSGYFERNEISTQLMEYLIEFIRLIRDG